MTVENFDRRSPFFERKISSHDVLRSVSRSRFACPYCQKSSMYYCCRCIYPDPRVLARIPKFTHLPFFIDILRHTRELSSKNTANHAKLLAPDYVNLYTYPDEYPPYDDTCDDVVLLYPDETSKPLSSLDFSKFKRILILDGTWSQANSMMIREPRLQNMRKIKIECAETNFWRYQHLGNKHLSTIETIYYMLVQFHTAFEKREYGGEYDDMLFFFSYMYELIQNYYNSNPGMEFRRKKGFIKSKE